MNELVWNEREVQSEVVGHEAKVDGGSYFAEMERGEDSISYSLVFEAEDDYDMIDDGFDSLSEAQEAAAMDWAERGVDPGDSGDEDDSPADDDSTDGGDAPEANGEGRAAEIEAELEAIGDPYSERDAMNDRCLELRKKHRAIDTAYTHRVRELKRDMQRAQSAAKPDLDRRAALLKELRELVGDDEAARINDRTMKSKVGAEEMAKRYPTPRAKG